MLSCSGSIRWLLVSLLVLAALVGCRRDAAGPSAQGGQTGTADEVSLTQAASEGRGTALALMKELPRFQVFEWSLVSAILEDPDISSSVVLDESAWEKTDAGELFGRLGISMDQTLRADWTIELSGPGPARNCVIFTWLEQETLDEVKKSYRLGTGTAPGSEEQIISVPDLPEAALSVTFAGSSLLLGQAEVIKQVAAALSGEVVGDSLVSDPLVAETWSALPAGFQMTVAKGDGHRFVSGQQAVNGWGRSTTKLNAINARTTFVAVHSSASAAANSENATLAAVAGVAELRGRYRVVKSVDVQENKVIIVYTEPLARMIF